MYWQTVVPVRVVALLTIAAAGSVGASRILMMTPIFTTSLKQLFYGLADALQQRGHEVVFFSNVKPSAPVPGLREVVPNQLAQVFAETNQPDLFRMNREGLFADLDRYRFLAAEGAKAALTSKELDQLLNEEFDIIIFGGLSYHLYFIPYLMQKPFIMVSHIGYVPVQTGPLGSPSLPALHPLTNFVAATDVMHFFTRALNVVTHAVVMYLAQRVYAPYCDQLVADKFGAGVIPPALQLERNASLILLNSSPALPHQVAAFIGDEEFVYFSLGSVVRSSQMTAEQRSAVLSALGALPYKVLLKWDTEERAGMPPNVLASRWLPQQDLLASGRCRLFVTHGGYVSVLESLCHGVPMVTLPVSSDHQANALHAVSLGAAELLSWHGLTAHTLREAITSALSEERRAAARYRQQLMREQPVSPRDLAVHWVEHVIRHGGAPHLRSVGAKLSFLQYYSLDVLAFLLAVLLLVLVLVLAALRCCWRCVCRRLAVLLLVLALWMMLAVLRCCWRCVSRRQADAEPKPNTNRAKCD